MYGDGDEEKTYKNIYFKIDLNNLNEYAKSNDKDKFIKNMKIKEETKKTKASIKRLEDSKLQKQNLIDKYNKDISVIEKSLARYVKNLIELETLDLND